jgi:hypothetical protein
MAHVQSTSENSYSATTTHTLAFTSNVTAGSFLLAAIRENNNVSAVADDVNGAWTELIDLDNTVVGLNVWYRENAAAGATTVTVTTSAGQTIRYAIAEYGDVPTSAVVEDYDSAAFTTTTTPATANVTTTDTDRTIVSVIATNLSATTIAPAGGETEREEVNERFQFQDEAAATAGDYSASWTLGATQPGVYAILALKPPATTKYLKVLAEAAAASDTAVAGRVFNGDDYIGAFTGQAWEADLESGEAVLLVAVADITPDGATLTTSDTPTVFAYNATDATSGPGTATVIEV